MKKRRLIFAGAAAIVLVLLVVTFTVISNQHKPEKTVEQFNQAVEDDEMDVLKELIVADKEDADINEGSLSALTDYLQANNESYQVIKDALDKQIENDDFTSSTAQINLFEDDKTLGLFPNYKLEVKTVNLHVKGKTDDEEVVLTVEDFDEPLDQIDDKKDIYEPMIPGEYTVEATVQNKLGELTKEQKTDVWGSENVSFLVDSEKLAQNNEDVQNEIIDAANQFNGDMAAFVTSDFDPDTFNNITKDFKKNLGMLNSGLPVPDSYIEELESQFLQATVNLDDLELTQFDGDWQAEVTMLVAYNEKIKLEDMGFEDLSYKEMRTFSLKYNPEQQQWMIDNLRGKKASEDEIDDWDNKVDIEVDDPPLETWSEDDDFI